MSKKIPKIFSYSDFAETQDKAVQLLLHHAHDHLLAARILRKNSTFLDSAAYICSLAFELLLKGIYLAECGEYEAVHNLIGLHDALSKNNFAKKDIPLLKAIDKYCLVRYPIDKSSRKKHKTLRIGSLSLEIDEIGTEDLEKADKLFCKEWRKLSKKKRFKSIIENIQENPYSKGNRILMRKKREC